MTASQLLADARKRQDHTQESLALAIRERFPRARTSKNTISQWERMQAWRPRDRTWRRLRTVLQELPPTPGQ
jgi:transcriptional regulator with XRE-family HTH domain